MINIKVNLFQSIHKIYEERKTLDVIVFFLILSFHFDGFGMPQCPDPDFLYR